MPIPSPATSQVCFLHLLTSLPAGDLADRALQAAGEPIMVFDRELRAELVNAAAARLYGPAIGQGSLCRDIFQAGGGCDKSAGQCWLQTVFATGTTLSTTARQSRRDGSSLFVEITASPVADESGRVAQVVVLLRDVSDKEQCREELAQISSHQLLCDNSPDGLISLAGDGTVTKANRTFLRLVGYPTAEVEGRLRLADLVQPDQEYFCADALTLLRDGKCVSCTELEWLRADGSTVWTRVKGVPVVHADAVGVLSIRDIEETPLEPTTLDTANRFTRAVLDSMGEGLLLLDTEYRILRANQRFLDLAATTTAEVVGRRCYEVSHQSKVPCWQLDAEHHECPTRIAIETGKPAVATHLHFDSKRAEHFIEVRAFPLKDRQGRVVQIIETHTDITEWKQMANRLRQAEKMESLGTLSGGIAHDLNNMLTPIIAYSDMELRQLADDHPLHESLREIRDAAGRASSLVRQILAFSRQTVLQKKVLDLNQVIVGIHRMLARLIREDVRLETHLAEDLLPVCADHSQLEQILVNLTVNARDAMPEGGRLTIETRNVRNQDSLCHTCGKALVGTYVLLQVSDEGHGIPPGLLHRIFEPFFTTKEVGKGTGMGLSTIVGIIHQHNGHVNVYSEEGMGSVFKVYLPAHHETLAADGEGHREQAPPPGRNERVLLVDDEDSVRQAFAAMLGRGGYRVVTARGGREALDLFTNAIDEFDLVITDVVMPDMNGRALMARIQALRPQLPVLFMSGYSANAIHHHFVLDEGIDYLQKPASVDELLHKVRQLLDRKEGC
ncbi:MAG: PAS domain-containing protein [Thermodesulfobacteriota bacterium]